ncbi:MAG: phosphatase PAP2 family protein [Burkholderiales bacterium]|nr:phosphatase PAP2 family protein [Burkholderiales bacterium]
MVAPDSLDANDLHGTTRSEPPEAPEHAGLDNRLVWATLFFALAVAAKFPGLDLLVSARYFDAARGFFHAQDPLVVALYDWTPWLGRGLALLMAIHALTAPWLARGLMACGRAELARRCQGPWRRVSAVFVCAALLGPGLVIEGVFKNTMGRPRPVQTIEFGGTEAFHGPFRPGHNPESHRSFTSSHAAAGFALMGLGLTCGPLWRRRWLLIGLVAGGVVGLGRILQGGHYLTDVVFSFYAVWLSCELVAWVDGRRLSKGQPPPSRRHRPAA